MTVMLFFDGAMYMSEKLAGVRLAFSIILNSTAASE
jgi:hypothetical protein